MPVEKLRAVDQRPGQVDGRRPLIALRRLKIRRHGFQFVVRGVARKHRQVEPVDRGRAAWPRLHQRPQLGALLDFELDVAGIEQVQALFGRGLVVALRGQPGIARRAAEEIEKRARNTAVGQRDGALVLGQEGERLGDEALIFLGGAGDLADGVDQHLGIEPAHRIPGELRRGLVSAGPSGASEDIW